MYILLFWVGNEIHCAVTLLEAFGFSYLFVWWKMLSNSFLNDLPHLFCLSLEVMMDKFRQRNTSVFQAVHSVNSVHWIHPPLGIFPISVMIRTPAPVHVRHIAISLPGGRVIERVVRMCGERWKRDYNRYFSGHRSHFHRHRVHRKLLHLFPARRQWNPISRVLRQSFGRTWKTHRDGPRSYSKQDRPLWLEKKTWICM